MLKQIVFYICAALLSLSFLTAAHARDKEARGVAADELWFAYSERGYALRARLAAGSESLIRPLLESGYAARFKFEMRFMQNRDWLPDRELGDVFWSPEIVYNSLLDRYAFSAGGAAEEYGDLAAVLRRAGTLHAAPQKSARLDEIFAAPDLYIIARFELLIDHLPQPLQVSLLTGDWEIDSGWRRFEVDVRAQK